ncbi:helix-turn-helix domain-containing protein [Bacteroidota bacterium]
MESNELLTRKDLYDLEAKIMDKLNKLSEKDDNRKKWYRTADLIKILNLSASSIQSLRTSGTLPFSKVGGTLFYDPNDVKEMITKNKKSI